MLVLGLDTALPACSAALLRDGRVLASLREPMMRGHQERLGTMVAEVMATAGARFADIDRIAVTVGPGSFTGLRVGLAFAKGLALALDRPCVGVGSLQALAASAATGGVVIAVIDAKRGQVYLQAFEGQAALCGPAALDLNQALARVAELSAAGAVTLTGSGASLLAGAAPLARQVTLDAPDPAEVARLGASQDPVPARPLYLRAPDARLPGGALPA